MKPNIDPLILRQIVGQDDSRYRSLDQYSRDWLAVRDACSLFYKESLTFLYRDQAPGQVTFPRSQAHLLVPASPGKRPDYYGNVLRKTSLYSDILVFVLPHAMDGYGTSYSEAGLRDDFRGHGSSPLDEIIELNRTFSDLVLAGRCIFLPSRLTFTFGSVSEDSRHEYMAPLLYPERDTPYLALNESRSFIQDPDLFFALTTVLLPYFPDIDLLTLLRLQDEETDAFIRFGYFLKKRVGALAIADSREVVQDIIDEIQYGVAELSLEARKLASKGALGKFHYSAFAVSLGALLLTPVAAAAAGSIAAVVGSVSAIDLAKEWQKRKEAGISLKQSDFYIPYLLVTQGATGGDSR